MKEIVCTIAGVVGSAVAALFGGWDSALITLLIFMGVDFVTGLVTAAMGKSQKTQNGGLNSTTGWQGLLKKFCVLLLLVVAVRIDILLGTTYIRDAVCIAFCCNELISILENTGLMGIPLPKPMKNAIEVLQEKARRTEREAEEKLNEKIEEENDNGNSES